MPTTRKIALALFAIGLVALGAWAYLSLRTPPKATHPIDAVPPDAFVAIELNIGALRKSGALAALFGDRDEQTLTKVCGFDPVDRMEDLVFTVPEGGNGDFGVAVEANMTADELSRCAVEVVNAHGGDPTSDTESRGDYVVMTPRRGTSDASKPPRSLAYMKGGPILVGAKGWLSTMIDAVGAAAEGKGSAGEHVRLRTELAEGVLPPPTLLLTASAILERSVREKLKAEMLAEVGTAEDSGTTMMLGVLGMSSGAVGLFEQGDDVRAVANLHCEEERQCAQVERLVLKVRDDWSRLDALRAFGLGPVLDGLEVDHKGTRLQIRAKAPTTSVVQWAKIFLASKSVVGTPVSAASRDGGTDVPTQTVKITVPDGVQPGQPFTVRIPAPSGSSPTTVQNLTVTVPSAKPATSASAGSAR